jgi:hypothetical protein
LVFDFVEQLKFEYNETTNVYYKAGFAVNGTILAISSAGIGYATINNYGINIKLAFAFAIIFTIGTHLFMKWGYNKRRHKQFAAIQKMYMDYIDNPNQLEDKDIDGLSKELIQIVSGTQITQYKAFNATVHWGNRVAAIAFTIGLLLLVFHK